MNHCIERARSGDRHATAAVVDALRPRITKMAAHYARECGEDRDDLLQEAWMGLLEALPEVDMRIGSPEQYLIQRARWRLLDAIKRARIRRCAPLDEELADSLLSTPMERIHASAFVSEFMSQLKPTQSAVLRCLMAGLTWREAGKALGFTSANVAHHVRQIQRRYLEWNDDQAPSAKIKESPRRRLAATPSRTTSYAEARSILRLGKEVGAVTKTTPTPGAGCR